MDLPIVYDDVHHSVRKRARLQYVEQQGGKCWYCLKDLQGPPAPAVNIKPLHMGLFPPNFLVHPVHLHHDRETGLTVGAVHAKCNGVLWQYHNQ